MFPHLGDVDAPIARSNLLTMFQFQEPIMLKPEEPPIFDRPPCTRCTVISVEEHQDGHKTRKVGSDLSRSVYALPWQTVCSSG